MRQVAPLRRDPAPSRWAFRMQRLWLTPLFRAFLRKGIPAFTAIFIAGWYVTDPARMEAMQAWVDDVRRSIAERPEFMVQLLRIEGASPELAGDIREILPLDLPVSSFDLELDHMRSEVAGLDAVAGAEMRVVAGGVLLVKVEERVPAVVWRRRDGLELLDAEGHRVAPLVERTARADLPLIVGEGADAAVPEALRLIALAGPVADRMRGLTRVGERRWDVILDRGQRILLPEAEPVAALERVIALDRAQDVLARDIAVIDMRDRRRPTLRLSAEAIEELRRMRGMDEGDDA